MSRRTAEVRVRETTGDPREAARNDMVNRPWQSHIATAEADAPTRARAVCAYIDLCERMMRGRKTPPLPNDPNRRSRRAIEKANKRAKGGGHAHPATRRHRQMIRRGEWEQDAEAREIHDLNRMMREAISQSPADGVIGGALTVAARYAAPHLAANIYALEAHERGPTRARGVLAYIDTMLMVDEDSEHVAAHEQYLKGLWGNVVAGYSAHEYAAWRSRSAN